MPDRVHLFDVKEPDFSFSDDRGTIFQLLHSGYKQANVVFTKKGKHRGRFHYHKENEELFYIVCGSVRVKFIKSEETQVRIFRSGDMFQIHKYVRHDFFFLEDTILLGFYDKGIEMADGHKDLYTDDLLSKKPSRGRGEI